MGVQNVHEMGWWQEEQLPNSPVTLACVPAQVLSIITALRHTWLFVIMLFDAHAVAISSCQSTVQQLV